MSASGAPPSAEVRRDEVCARFPANIESPRATRHFVTDVMRRWGFGGDALDEAALVASELAANAVLHADSAFSVVLLAGNAVVRIAVHDTVPIDPLLMVVRPGRGLGLVAGLSRDWGVDITADGKTVWAEIGERDVEVLHGRRAVI
jgi:anti-sigma regulatory factor (Ser/Thr protein kinase)